MNEVDWNDLWRKAKLNSTWRKVFGDNDTVEYWNRRAESFNRNAGDKRGELTVDKLVKLFGIDETSTVLDIGAGTGRLAIPLARVAKSVTAVEPSPEMMKFLKMNASAERLGNISFVQKRWGDAAAGKEIKKHDIVIACHSLSMMNIRNALAKMNELCERYACIYAFGGKRVWDFTNLWPRLYGEKFVPGPSYIYLVNLLYYMSINANVEINKRKMERRYGNLDSAMEETKIKLDIRDDKKDGIIRKYLIDTLQEENGELFHVKEFEEVMIWWEK
ncbi:MAG: class I SAM-dependent methyltransferase [Candidatus Thermoplasmatota archaeon]|jgi:SAM-dependent methyltransferase|nr:class I SAM-dependent methyltransferase [Candidatus Thermoplasmatota archaeon]